MILSIARSFCFFMHRSLLSKSQSRRNNPSGVAPTTPFRVCYSTSAALLRPSRRTTKEYEKPNNQIVYKPTSIPFNQTPLGTESSPQYGIEQHRYYFDWFAEKHSIYSQEDWYQIKLSQITQEKILKYIFYDHYNGDLCTALSILYPQYTWHPWKFSDNNAPFGGSWMTNRSHHKLFFDWLEKQLLIQQPSDWFQVKTSDVYRHGAKSILVNYYSNSLSTALQSLYPQYDWQPWKFVNTHLPPHYWKDLNNQKSYIQWLSNQLSISSASLDDWYRISLQDIHSKGGGDALQSFQHLIEMLQAVYPDHPWQVWRFEHLSIRFWKHKKNHRLFMDWFGKEMKIRKLSDWVHVQPSDIYKGGGYGMLKHSYNDSVIHALEAIYPNEQWNEYHNNNNSTSKKNNIDNHRDYFEWVGGILGVKEPSDWYSVKIEDIYKR